MDAAAMKVNSAGIDLNSDVGAQVMFNRLTIAAAQVCGGADAEFDALRTVVYRACYKETLSNAVRSLNAPMVTHVYVAQYPSDAARYGIAEGSYVAGR
jgi:UrcA family protein